MAAQIELPAHCSAWGRKSLLNSPNWDINTEARGAATDFRGSARTLWKIQTALESAGVEFIPADETKGPGVRLKHRTTKRAERAPARRKKG